MTAEEAAEAERGGSVQAVQMAPSSRSRASRRLSIAQSSQAQHAKRKRAGWRCEKVKEGQALGEREGEGEEASWSQREKGEG